MLKENLAKKLKAVRKKNNWTQEEAAELCDLSPRFWGKMERGTASASVETLEKIALGLKISVSELFQNEDDSNEEAV